MNGFNKIRFDAREQTRTRREPGALYIPRRRYVPPSLIRRTLAHPRRFRRATHTYSAFSHSSPTHTLKHVWPWKGWQGELPRLEWRSSATAVFRARADHPLDVRVLARAVRSVTARSSVITSRASPSPPSVVSLVGVVSSVSLASFTRRPVASSRSSSRT